MSRIGIWGNMGIDCCYDNSGARSRLNSAQEGYRNKNTGASQIEYTTSRGHANVMDGADPVQKS